MAANTIEKETTIPTLDGAEDGDGYLKHEFGQQHVDDGETFTVAEQRKIVHKIDRRLLVILGLMQSVSFVDRTNVSNAAVAGMTKELGLEVGTRYSIVLLVFSAPHAVLQFPASILVRKADPRLFLSSVVLMWGIVMMVCTDANSCRIMKRRLTFPVLRFRQNWKALIGLRFPLGALEACCFPSQYYLISSCYSRYDLYSRTSVLYLIGVFGSAIGDLLALAFTKMAGLTEYASGNCQALDILCSIDVRQRRLTRCET